MFARIGSGIVCKEKKYFPGKTQFLAAVLEQLEHYPGHPWYEVKC